MAKIMTDAANGHEGFDVGEMLSSPAFVVNIICWSAADFAVGVFM
jgi:hypothetical protein